MNSFESIHNLLTNSDDIKVIDAIINCAATYNTSRSINQHNIEEMFMVNYLGFFYLIGKLTNKLSKGDNSKVVNMAAENFSKLNK
ncbi:MAG: hypothetical protein JXB00_10600 [Bacteroidales bacterium]|nr:hypothetical protein [Bacteroidales bacterium]